MTSAYFLQKNLQHVTKNYLGRRTTTKSGEGWMRHHEEWRGDLKDEWLPPSFRVKSASRIYMLIQGFTQTTIINWSFKDYTTKKVVENHFILKDTWPYELWTSFLNNIEQKIRLTEVTAEVRQIHCTRIFTIPWWSLIIYTLMLQKTSDCLSDWRTNLFSEANWMQWI